VDAKLHGMSNSHVLRRYTISGAFCRNSAMLPTPIRANETSNSRAIIRSTSETPTVPLAASPYAYAAPKQHRIGSKRQRFDNLAASRHTAVKENFRAVASSTPRIEKVERQKGIPALRAAAAP
jgi:hypothetical protein